MRVLIVGSGGREHAMASAVRRSRPDARLYCASGNAGTAGLGENVAIDPLALDELASFAKERAIDLTLVGPEAPLCAGIVDRFQRQGLCILGPTAAAARLEGDKTFSKMLMIEAGVPTARGRCFDRFHDARAYIATRDTPQVVKAAGLAAGKGVIVCEDPADALVWAERIMVDGAFGEAGRSVVVEEKLEGAELSVHALVDGDNIYVLESSQDHKRAGDGDTGPNTGGMGAYSPAPIATAAVLDVVEEQVIVPILDALRRHDIVYRGVLYCGLMVTPGGPKVLEFNCRFGDPETQVILSRLTSDFVALAQGCVDGRLDEVEVGWDPRASVCVVMSSKGYPGAYPRGLPITGLEDVAAMGDVTVYHAGTRVSVSGTITSGGRVLGVTALGETIAAAQALAYRAVERISFEGAHYRRDIADRAIAARA